ncbi:uncharacterized protein LOC115627863 [Scaptodrosophila lebanonensis]|uniref:Uncharacterized protein LOC115627863 n=1 Tax=Drosophila lebanonensis TaxID=7225 RepID=A0A6J2TVM3_DROLE|nr:uncharacterized protein LOC115627863 [Scaptodrosophila lebanonensis]
MPRRNETRLRLIKKQRQPPAKKFKPETSFSGSEEESDLSPYSFRTSDEEDGDSDTKKIRKAVSETPVVVPHFTCPVLNKGLGASKQLVAYPSCSLSEPTALFVTNRTTPIMDPCLTRCDAVENWTARSEWLRHEYLKETEKMKQREKKHKHNIYNHNLYRFAEHVALQEYPYFRDSYDYHYTGGSLSLMQFGDIKTSMKLALHVSGPKLQDLHFSQFDGTTDAAEQWRLEPFYSQEIDSVSDEIFEILPIESFRANHGNMFLARSLTEICIYELKRCASRGTTEYELNLQGKYSSHNGPFISAAQGISDVNTLAIACQDRTVRFVDLVTSSDIAKHDVCMVNGLKQTANNWAQLLPCLSEKSSFYYACQPVLLTIDMRCASDNNNPCFASSAYSNMCETFSCLARSANPNLLYVGSNHKLHCLDMRCLGKKLTDRSVITWTHQMRYPPTFMDAFMHDGSEYVALCSPLPSDQRICELTGALANSFTEMSSPTFPYAPVTMEEALRESRVRGFVDVYADLGERIKTHITGLKFHSLDNPGDNSFAQLLTSNSMGDVYCQRLTVRKEEDAVQETRIGPHTDEALRVYGRMVRKKVTRTLKCTAVDDIKVMREIMGSGIAPKSEEELEIEDVTIDYGFEPPNDESDGSQNEKPETSQKKKKEPKPEDKTDIKKKIKALNRGSWQKSAYKLCNYNDFLSKRLLSIWEIDEKYDLTPDVDIKELDSKLMEGIHDNYDHTETWLKKLPKAEEMPALINESKSPFVEGTDLPKYDDAINADYEVIDSLTNEADLHMKVECEESYNETLAQRFSIQAHSTLQPDQFTAVEFYYEPSTSQSRPTKRAKTKSSYQKGF